MEISSFKEYKITLKESSKDKHDETNIEYMSELEYEVTDFDKIKNVYLSELNPKPSDTPLSNDALFNYKDEWFFIEFKNGTIDNLINAEVKTKLYDSLLIFLDIINKDIEYTRNKMNYILVFNEQKIENRCTSRQFNKDEYLKYNEIPSENSPSFADFTSLMDDLSGNFGRAQFGLEKYENFLFHKVLTIPKYRFDRYIKQFFD